MVKASIRALLISWTLLLGAICTGCTSACPPTDAEQGAPNEDAIQMIQLEYVDAAEAAHLAHDLFGVTAASESTSNTVVMKGNPKMVKGGGDVLIKLDSDPDRDGLSTYLVYHVKNARVEELARTLQAALDKGLFADSSRRHATRVIVGVDAHTNSLLLGTSEAYRNSITNILDQLDQPATQPSGTNSQSK